MARGLLAARRRYPADQAFGMWLATSPYCKIEKNERADLIKIGEHEDHIAKFIHTTALLSPRTIWAEYGGICEQLASVSHHGKPTVAPTLPPEVPTAVAIEAPVEKQESQKPEVEVEKTDDDKSASKRSESKLYKMGDEIANVLMDKFKHPRMLAHYMGIEDNQQHRRKRLLRYLAARIKANYPEECLAQKAWSWRLLYPHLPQKLLDMYAKHQRMINENHATLVATEELFMKTPECGVVDPPMVAFNKAYSIYQSVLNAKAGHTVDPSVKHRPKFENDEGKAPVIVRGTQVWPRAVGPHTPVYGYDDLRCAYNLAADIVVTFDEERNASMAARSLKLRHILSWFPGGYNSVGVTSLESLMSAFRVVVQAYGANASDVMRPPEASLKKLGE
jgi:hypothetical protein